MNGLFPKIKSREACLVCLSNRPKQAVPIQRSYKMGKRRWYFPSKDADVIPWARNFVTVLAANAARWGIAETLVAGLGSLGTAFEDAYNKRMHPESGKVSTEQKNLALMKGVQNMVTGHINHNPAVTPDDRIALGLYVYAGRSPVPEPATTVVLRAAAGLVRQLKVYFTDSATPEKRGKPYGVENIELVCGVQASPPARAEDLPRSVTASKSPLILSFREEDRGKTVYMAGRWKTGSQKEGPWSGIISAIVP
jgi:hypothetical protein